MVQPHPVDDEDPPEPPRLRRLRLLVSLLMVVLIGGMVVVAVTMVLRLGALDSPDTAPGPVGATKFTLPLGAEVVSLWRVSGEVLILTRDATGAETIRVFDSDSGALISATPIFRE